MQKFEIVGIVNENKKIVKDENGRLLYWKQLENYNRSVFAWIQEHPNMHIPEIISMYENDKGLVVVEEYIEGVTLETLLVHDIARDERMDILEQLLDGLDFLHKAMPPIIHRDIKASNIMIDDNRCVKIIDYDAAKRYNKNEPRDTVLLGTEGSAAPEQYGFGASDARTDIYAIGILIREMFSDDLHLLDIADKCTQIDPKNRYQNVQELKKAIQAPVVQNKLHTLNIPGFRQGNPYHMIVAILGYALMIYICLTTENKVDGQVITNPFLVTGYRLTMMYMMLGWLDVFTSWTGFYDKFPFMKSENMLLRWIGYSMACIFVVIVTGVLIVFLQLAG